MSKLPNAESQDPDHKLLTDERAGLLKLLTGLLDGANAHISFEDAVKGIPPEYYGVVPEGLPYSLWQLVEHIRIAQRDILEFSRDADYQSPVWPKGYWPSNPEPANRAAWKNSVEQVINDRKEFLRLLKDKDSDLYKAFPHGNGQNLVREALLIADHTAYHVGEIVAIRRMIGIYH